MSGLYTRVPEADLEKIQLRGTWVAVKERLEERTRESGLVEVAKKATTIGSVLAVGTEVSELSPGDDIVYEAWEGGRWMLGDIPCLLMQLEHVLARIEYAE